MDRTDTTVHSYSVRSIGAGRTRALDVLVPLRPSAVQPVYLLAFLDATQRVTESSEDDNLTVEKVR